VAVNCAAIPIEMAEAELFGYRRGAFSGALGDSSGYFRAAAGGTLLLDEIDELPLVLQTKLLRVVQSGAVTPLGETTPRNADVRFIAAGQSNLSESVRLGRFRADLYARLSGLTVWLPPLNERKEDVPGLFLRELERHGRAAESVDARLLEALCLYPWPQNIRE
jgi:transcriptional regulator with PAS, ATPase and Fis domain